MADDFEYFADAALVGHLVTVSTLAKLVDKGLISVADGIDVLDAALIQLEEWQSLFPAHHRRAFELARGYLEVQLAAFETIRKAQHE
jgi:hypothetical protein